MKYIAIFNDQLNDININGFALMSENEMEKYEELLTSIDWGFSYEIGNEILEYVNGEDLLSKIEFKAISIEEFRMLEKLFNRRFGIFITESFINNIVEDEIKIDDNYDDEKENENDDYDDY